MGPRGGRSGGERTATFATALLVALGSINTARRSLDVAISAALLAGIGVAPRLLRMGRGQRLLERRRPRPLQPELGSR